MRAKYYALTLRQMSFKKSFVFFLIFFLVISFFLNIVIRRVEPTINKICESNAKSIAVKSASDAIYKNTENITYDSLIVINKDNSGKVTSLNANSKEINKLTSKVINDIEENLQKKSESKIKIPIGIIFDENIVSGYGPRIKIKTYPIGDIKAELKSSFESAGINQTRHSLNLEVTIEEKVVAPFISYVEEYKTSVVIAETIIISDIPSTYYNISGVENLNPKDTLNILE